MVKRKKISARGLIFDRDNFICYLCKNKFDKKDLHVDHIFPVSKGGSNSLSNLKTCCKKCNIIKRDSIVFRDIHKYFIVDDDYIYINPQVRNLFDIKYIVAYIDKLMEVSV